MLTDDILRLNSAESSASPQRTATFDSNVKLHEPNINQPHTTPHHDRRRVCQSGRWPDRLNPSSYAYPILQLTHSKSPQSSIEKGHERCQTPPRIPRQLRQSPNSTQSMSIRRVLSAMEMRGVYSVFPLKRTVELICVDREA